MTHPPCLMEGFLGAHGGLSDFMSRACSVTHAESPSTQAMYSSMIYFVLEVLPIWVPLGIGDTCVFGPSR